MDRSREHLVGVVNSTPLIALSIVGHLDLLPALLDGVVIPASVHKRWSLKDGEASGLRRWVRENGLP